MKLYHGSNMEIHTICLDKCNPYKDFGRGFYLTDIEEQAKLMAMRRTRIAGEGKQIVSTYSFDETLLHDTSLQVKIFDSPSEEWGRFSARTLHKANYYLRNISQRIDL